METVELNINRLNHVMALYGVSKDELLLRLNENRKKKLSDRQVFREVISLALLKQIDDIFKKGLAYYLDPKDPVKSKEESIFFRKSTFNADLNLGAKQVVNKFEQEKLSLSALAKLADFKTTRQLPVFKVSQNSEIVSKEVRQILYPEFSVDKKEFLKNFISKLSDFNILVFEFVETHNKKEKANINGIFLSPDVIVLKRDQKAIRRELFTLAHELGHYLLNEEEIDDKISGDIAQYDKLSEIEKWCSDFAFHFLAGQYGEDIKSLNQGNTTNDYHHDLINEISRRTHLSRSSLYFRLWINKTISTFDYNNVTSQIRKEIESFELAKKKEQELKRQKEIDEGRKPRGSVARPIIAPLYISTLRGALYNGLISEREFCKRLNIEPKTLGKYLV